MQTKDAIGAQTAGAGFSTWLLALLAGGGLLLAAVGIYGVIAYFVTHSASIRCDRSRNRESPPVLSGRLPVDYDTPGHRGAEVESAGVVRCYRALSCSRA